MRTDKDKPARVLRYRNIKAVIWRNESEKGPWYSVKFVRTYKDGDDYKDTDTFSGDQLLVLQHLSAKAFDAVAALEEQDRENAKKEAA